MQVKGDTVHFCEEGMLISVVGGPPLLLGRILLEQ